MIYLMLLSFTLFYLKSIDRYLDFKGAYILLIPFAALLLIIPSIQYGIGTDYFSYIHIYSDDLAISRLQMKGELLFYHLYSIANFFELGPQSIFLLSSLIVTLSFTSLFYRLRKDKFDILILFFLFFVVTNIYHNQMNGLRQYVALSFFPLIYFSYIKKEYLLSCMLSLLAFYTHSSALICVLLFIVPLGARLSYNKLMVLFFLMPLLISYVSEWVGVLIEDYIPWYSHYLSVSYGKALPLSSIFSKLYYFPLYIFFWLIVTKIKTNEELNNLSNNYVFKCFITLWVITYWMFLLYLDYGFFFRVASYFFFFYIFPLYFIIKYLLSINGVFRLLLVYLYLLAPYFYKVVVAPVEVFTFRTNVF